MLSHLAKAMKLKTDYSYGDLLRATFDMDLAASPTAHFSGVVGYQGFHAGYQTSYDSGASKLLAHNFFWHTRRVI